VPLWLAAIRLGLVAFAKRRAPALGRTPNRASTPARLGGIFLWKASAFDCRLSEKRHHPSQL